MNYNDVISILELNDTIIDDLLGAFGDERYEKINSEQIQYINFIQLNVEEFEEFITMTPETIAFIEENSHLYIGNSLDVNSNPSRGSILNQQRYELYQMKNVEMFVHGEPIKKINISEVIDDISDIFDISITENTGLEDKQILLSSGDTVVCDDDSLFSGSAITVNNEFVFDFYYYVDRDCECNAMYIENQYNTILYKAVKKTIEKLVQL